MERTTKNAEGSNKSLHQSKIPNLKTFQSNNLPFGDDIHNSSEVEGFLFHNINGIKDEFNWTQINLTMAELNITCFGFVEINTTLRGPTFSKWADITRKTFQFSRSSSSESDMKFDSNYKPGGTLTTVVGGWQARISDRGSDPTGLGRWNYLKFSSNRKNLIVITAYRPCKTTGPTTTWTQQWLILRETIKNPDPIKAFDDDLAETVKKWKQQGYEILLMIDANDDIGEKPGGMSKAIYQAGLSDLISRRHNAEKMPNTYARGTK
jgi:hypothetical protein